LEKEVSEIKTMRVGPFSLVLQVESHEIFVEGNFFDELHQSPLLRRFLVHESLSLPPHHSVGKHWLAHLHGGDLTLE
jgi:hypothetical protein